jgi:hypothetical protein
VFIYATNPLLSDADVDGNGIVDRNEDTNSNGIPNGIELLMGYNPALANSLGSLHTPGYSVLIAAPKSQTQIP